MKSVKLHSIYQYVYMCAHIDTTLSLIHATKRFRKILNSVNNSL